MRILSASFSVIGRATLSVIKIELLFLITPSTYARIPLPRKIAPFDERLHWPPRHHAWSRFYRTSPYQTGRFPGAHNLLTWEKSSISWQKARKSIKFRRSAGRRLPGSKRFPPASWRSPEGGRRNDSSGWWQAGGPRQQQLQRICIGVQSRAALACGSGQRPPMARLPWIFTVSFLAQTTDVWLFSLCRPADPVWDTCSWRSVVHDHDVRERSSAARAVFDAHPGPELHVNGPSMAA